MAWTRYLVVMAVALCALVGAWRVVTPPAADGYAGLQQASPLDLEWWTRPSSGAGVGPGWLYTTVFAPNTVSAGPFGDGRLDAGHALGRRITALGWLAPGSFGMAADDGMVEILSMDSSTAGAPERVERRQLPLSEPMAIGPDVIVGIDRSSNGLRRWNRSRDQFQRTDVSEIVTAIAVGPEGVVGFGDETGAVWVWPPDAERPSRLSGGHGAPIQAIAAGPGGIWITGDSGGQVMLWEGRTARELTSPETRHSVGVTSVAAAPDGRQFATADGNGDIRIWSADGAPGDVFVTHSAEVRALAFNEERWLASGDTNGRVTLRDETGRRLRDYPIEGLAVERIVFNPGQPDHLIVGDASGALSVRDLGGAFRSEGPGSIMLNGGAVTALACATEGGALISGGADGAVRWHIGMPDAVETGQAYADGEPPHDGEVTALVNAGEGYALSGGADGSRLWDTRFGSTPSAPPLAQQIGQDAITALASADDGRSFAFGYQDGIIAWGRMTDEGLTDTILDQGARVSALAFGAEAAVLIAGDEDGRVRFWSPDGDDLRTIDVHDTAVRRIVVTADGDTAITASADGRMAFVSFDGFAIRDTIMVSDAEIVDLAVAPSLADGSTFLATLDGDNRLRLWSLDGVALGQRQLDAPRATSLAVCASDRAFVGDRNGWVTALSIGPTHLGPSFAEWLLLLLGVIGLPIAAFLVRAPQQSEFVLEADRPLEDPEEAPEELRGIAERLSRFMLNRDTDAPIVFAVSGPWGVGKSSVMNLVHSYLRAPRKLSTGPRDRLRRWFAPSQPVVWFNAWHHQNEGEMLAALMETVRSDAFPPAVSLRGLGPTHLGFRMRLLLSRAVLRPITFIFSVLGLLLVIKLGLWLIGDGFAPIRQAFQHLGATMVDGDSQTTNALATFVKLAFVVIASLVGLNALRRTLFTEFMGSFPVPSPSEQPRRPWLRLLSFYGRTGYRHQVADTFREVCLALGDKRLVIIVDDLDRCQPDQVVAVLEGLHFITSCAPCFVVVGIWEEPVRDALRIHFRSMAEEKAAAECLPSASEADLARCAAHHRDELARRHLEKVFQVTLPVPPTDASTNGRKRRRSFGVESRWIGGMLIAVLAFIGSIWLYDREPVVGPLLDGIEGGTDVGISPDDTTGPRPASLPGRVDAEPAPGPGPSSPASTPTPVDPAPSGQPPDEPEIREESVVGILWPLAILVLASVLAGVAALFDASRLHDSDAFKEALGRWRPLPATERSRDWTPRTRKRFDNRLRFMAAGLEKGQTGDDSAKLERFIALAAVEAARAQPFQNRDSFNSWLTDGGFENLNGNAGGGSGSTADTTGHRSKAVLEDISEEEWNEYRRLTDGTWY